MNFPLNSPGYEQILWKFAMSGSSVFSCPFIQKMFHESPPTMLPTKTHKRPVDTEDNIISPNLHQEGKKIKKIKMAKESLRSGSSSNSSNEENKVHNEQDERVLPSGYKRHQSIYFTDLASSSAAILGPNAVKVPIDFTVLISRFSNGNKVNYRLFWSRLVNTVMHRLDVPSGFSGDTFRQETYLNHETFSYIHMHLSAKQLLFDTCPNCRTMRLDVDMQTGNDICHKCQQSIYTWSPESIIYEKIEQEGYKSNPGLWLIMKRYDDLFGFGHGACHITSDDRTRISEIKTLFFLKNAPVPSRNNELTIDVSAKGFVLVTDKLSSLVTIKHRFARKIPYLPLKYSTQYMFMCSE